jgi:2-methylcitrate dehydratase PrpD
MPHVPAPTPVRDFIHVISYGSLPDEVRRQMRRCLLDTVGVAAAGTATPMSRILRDHAHRQGAGGPCAPRLMFDGRRVGAAHAALANAGTIDSMDGHDGHRIVKGHAGPRSCRLYWPSSTTAAAAIRRATT